MIKPKGIDPKAYARIDASIPLTNIYSLLRMLFIKSKP
jgi:hypothetical protein